MTEIKNNNKGEKLSFYKLIRDKNYSINIPIIQRDYAQGRESAYDVRINFLNSLYDYLNGDRQIDLDFIYGSVLNGNQNNKFIPLDGQQRLTTLFLLHWYLAAKENRLDEFRNIIISENTSRFTYETRITSRDFCNSLVTNDLTIPEQKQYSVSNVIKDSSWFFLSWENDPTIVSMLVMIDAIHQRFFESVGFFDKLINAENPLITFQFIELENFGLSDNLYIKMNARGKELTSFENFKAKFEQLLEKRDKINDTKFKDEFSLKIDTEWTDLFWCYKNDTTMLFDEQFMNFIRVMITNNYALRENITNFTSNLRLLIGKDNPENYFERSVKIDYYKYEELNCFDDELINDVIKTLDFIKNGTNKIRIYLSNQLLINERELFEKVIDNNLTYTERIQFFALYQFLVQNNNLEGLDDWIRVIRNLTENTIYNVITEYTASIKSIKDLLSNSKNILFYISDLSNELKGFATIQIEEERIKAILILKNDEWKKSILLLENHGYFKGQIGFILKFSGISEYYKSNKNLNWSDSENEVYFKAFNNYSEKSSYLFLENGVRKFDDYLFERALLSKGDYLLYKRRNYSFLIDSVKERDISWKRILRDDNAKRDYIKDLLDDINIPTCECDLKTIIQSSNIKDWRRYFISYPEIIQACGFNKFIRKENENYILLLEKTQTNGTHREYYSYALYLKLKKLGNNVLYEDSISVEYLKYISFINSKKVMIYYWLVTGGWKYIFKKDGQELYFNNEEEIIQYLAQNDYLIESNL